MQKLRDLGAVQTCKKTFNVEFCWGNLSSLGDEVLSDPPSFFPLCIKIWTSTRGINLFLGKDMHRIIFDWIGENHKRWFTLKKGGKGKKECWFLHSIVNIFFDNGTNVWNYETNPINFVFVPVVSNLVHLVIPCGLYNVTSPVLSVVPKFTKLAFLQLVKPFIEPKTYKKVSFVYSNGPQSQKLMEELFDMDKLDCAFGGRNSAGFNYEAYAQWMREDDKKKFDMMNCGSSSPLPSIMSESQSSETLTPSGISMASDEDDSSSGDEKSLNLENIDEKTQGLPPSGEDVAVSEAVDIVKELKKGELAWISNLGECGWAQGSALGVDHTVMMKLKWRQEVKIRRAWSWHENKDRFWLTLFFFQNLSKWLGTRTAAWWKPWLENSFSFFLNVKIKLLQPTNCFAYVNLSCTGWDNRYIPLNLLSGEITNSIALKTFLYISFVLQFLVLKISFWWVQICWLQHSNLDRSS